MEQKDYWLAGLGTFITVAVPVLVAAAYKLRKQTAQLSADRKKSDRSDRKDAMDEYVQIIQKQNEVIDGHEKDKEEVKKEFQDQMAQQKAEFDRRIEAIERKYEAAEQRSQRCERDHAGTFATLRIVLAWAKQRGLKIPDNVLPSGMATGSDLHRSIQDQEKKDE